jgi:hypothetical protein
MEKQNRKQRESIQGKGIINKTPNNTSQYFFFIEKRIYSPLCRLSFCCLFCVWAVFCSLWNTNKLEQEELFGGWTPSEQWMLHINLSSPLMCTQQSNQNNVPWLGKVQGSDKFWVPWSNCSLSQHHYSYSHMLVFQPKFRLGLQQFFGSPSEHGSRLALSTQANLHPLMYIHVTICFLSLHWFLRWLLAKLVKWGKHLGFGVIKLQSPALLSQEVWLYDLS